MENNTQPSLKFLGAFFAAFIVLFGVFIFSQEYTLHSGDEILLETAPVDPRDLLRGDYVILRYSFENSDVLNSYLSENDIEENTTLYISFKSKPESDVHVISGVSEIRPTTGVFLKTITRSRSWGGVRLETGIGKYFVPEGTGREIEKIRGDMNVKVSVDSYGSSQIIDLYYKGEKINPKTFSY